MVEAGETERRDLGIRATTHHNLPTAGESSLSQLPNTDGGMRAAVMTDKTYRRIFLVGALWNLMGTGLFFLFWRQAFALFQLAHPNYLAFFQAWLALAFVFGIGYYYVYRDLYGNLNIVRLGIYGKTAFALIFIYHVIFSGFHPVFLSGAFIDLIFVILYARFLAYARKRSA
jgi:hypothetical protein